MNVPELPAPRQLRDKGDLSGQRSGKAEWRQAQVSSTVSLSKSPPAAPSGKLPAACIKELERQLVDAQLQSDDRRARGYQGGAFPDWETGAGCGRDSSSFFDAHPRVRLLSVMLGVASVAVAPG